MRFETNSGRSGGAIRALALLAILAAMPGAALAADATLTVIAGGEGFDGPPKFAVSFAGRPVGDATVEQAVDTRRDGRFADAGDKERHVGTFTFKVPEALFEPDAEVEVRLTNEAHGAPGSRDDRELYIRSLAVNGAVLPADALAMRSALGVEPTTRLGDYLVVSEAAVAAVGKAPPGGWPATGPTAPDAAAADATAPVAAATAPEGTADAVAAPVTTVPDAAVPETAAAAPAGPAVTAAATPIAAPLPTPPARPAEVVPVPKPATVAAVTGAAAGPAASPAEATARPAPATPAKTAAAEANPDPEGGAPGCGLSRSFHITGFSENSNQLTRRVTGQLDRVVEAIGAQRCTVRVTGYSSPEGDFAHNALFSIERAQNALRYLGDKGVKFRRFSANGVGETRQFGPGASANRRVVVTVSP